MDPARPLHSVFAELTGGRGFAATSDMSPDEVLAANGHPDLPEGLIAEAVVNYADTAPYEVAEHLAPYVRANTAVPQVGEQSGDEPHWYDLLTTAPAVSGLDGHDVLDDEASALAAAGETPTDAGAPTTAAGPDIDAGFGHGHRGPAEDPTTSAPADDAPTADATLGWPASTDMLFDSGEFAADSGVDVSTPDAEATPGDDESDAIDGA